MTLIEQARTGKVTDAMRAVASDENVPVEQILDGIKCGVIVIPRNAGHDTKPHRHW